MRCRERAAFGEAPTSRTRPGTAVVPSGWSAGLASWAGPPGSWSGPPGEMREVYRPGEYDCTAPFVQLRHQGRLRGTRNHEDGRIDGVARPGDVLPRAAVGKCTRSGAAAPNCNSRTSGRRSSGGCYSSSFTQGEWSEGGGRGRALGGEGTRAIASFTVADEHPAQGAPHVLNPPVVREP